MDVVVSVWSLHTKFFGSDTRVAGALKGVHGVDTQVIKDGHYFVVVSSSGAIVASGGWSHRTLFGSDTYATRDDNTLLNPATQPSKIRAMFVHSDWVRQGIGKMVLEAGEQAAREAGFKSMEISATLNGVPFYGKYGYREVEGGRHEVKLDDGEVIDLYMMRKDLVC